MLAHVATTLEHLVDRTDQGFREIRETLANHYVPRNEIDRRFDDTNLDVTSIGQRVRVLEDRAVQEARDRVAAAEAEERARVAAAEQEARDRVAAEAQAERDARDAARQARRDRWQRIAVLASSTVAVLGTATTVVLHFT